MRSCLRLAREHANNSTVASTRPTIRTHLLLRNEVRVSAFVEGVEPLAFGRVLGPCEGEDPDTFRVRFDGACSSMLGISADSHHSGARPASSSRLPVQVGSKVWVESQDRTSSGIVTRDLGNGTFGILFNNGHYDPVVGMDRIVVCEGRPPLFQTERFRGIVEWIRQAGVERRQDAEIAAYVLCRGVWRKEKLYLLSADDIASLSHLHRSTRLCILEMAEWEREVVRQERDKERENEKEQDRWYFCYKYSGIASTIAATLGVCSVFLWNFLNYHRNRREYQMNLVLHALTVKDGPHEVLSSKQGSGSAASPGSVPRTQEQQRLRKAFESFDISHPRCLVVLGPRGAGKSTLCETLAAGVKGVVYVSPRVGWSNDDLVRNLAKSMGVVNVDTCGNILGFITEALRTVAEKNGYLPIVLFGIQFSDDSNENRRLAALVFNMQRLLSTQMRIAVTVSEIDETAVHINPARLPEFDFHYIPEFTEEEAMSYLGHRVSDKDAEKAIQALGCNGTLLDQMVSSNLLKIDTCDTFIRRRLLEAALDIRSFLQKNGSALEVVRHLSHNPLDQGVGLERFPEFANEGVPNSVFHVNWQRRIIRFNNKLLHTAAVHMFECEDHQGSSSAIASDGPLHGVGKEISL